MANLCLLVIQLLFLNVTLPEAPEYKGIPNDQNPLWESQASMWQFLMPHREDFSDLL